MEKRFVLAGLLFLFGCSGGKTKPVVVPPEPMCGDGDLSQDEECEGSNLRGATCQSLGFDDGALTCQGCKLVKTMCTKQCGNGTVEPGEGCDGKTGVGTCTTFGYFSCSAACQLETQHCVTALFVGQAALSVAKGGPAVIGDLEPVGLGDLVMAVPSFGRVETFGYTIASGFQPGRKLSFGRTPIAVAAADLDGDGRTDLASIDADGAIDRYLFQGGAFAFSSFPDAGCPSSAFLGSSDAGLFAVGCAGDGGFGAVVVQRASGAPFVIDAPGRAATLADFDRDGRPDVLVLTANGLEPRLAPAWDAGAVQAVAGSPLEIAAGDFDADGDLDLAAVDAAGVTLLENTGTAFAVKQTLGAAGARQVKVADLDLDGRPDVLWVAGDTLQVRRNQGAWSFSTATGALSSGPLISFALGDADGDGDLDVAATFSAGGEATVTSVLVNKVR